VELEMALGGINKTGRWQSRNLPPTRTGNYQDFNIYDMYNDPELKKVLDQRDREIYNVLKFRKQYGSLVPSTYGPSTSTSAPSYDPPRHQDIMDTVESDDDSGNAQGRSHGTWNTVKSNQRKRPIGLSDQAQHQKQLKLNTPAPPLMNLLSLSLVLHITSQRSPLWN
jgi:hypothetical protein